MTSKSSKAKRRAIPAFTIAELEDAGRLEPRSYLIDSTEKWLVSQQKRKKNEPEPIIEPPKTL